MNKWSIKKARRVGVSADGFAMKLEDQQGMRHRRRKLTDKQVLEIRREYDSGFRGRGRSSFWGLSEDYYNQIGRRKAWGSLDEQQLGKGKH